MARTQKALDYGCKLYKDGCLAAATTSENKLTGGFLNDEESSRIFESRFVIPYWKDEDVVQEPKPSIKLVDEVNLTLLKLPIKERRQQQLVASDHGLTSNDADVI